MAYTKLDLFNDIHALVEKYIEQELANMLPDEDDGDILVESDDEGDNIDMVSGDIWDLDAQQVIGHKDLKSGEKTWFTESPPDAATPEDED